MTDAPAELLRQLHEDERVLWHARPRFLRLKQQLCQLLVTGLLAWFIAFLGRHSHGCMVETVMFRDADGVPHTITLRCRNGEDTRYFTPGASLPLVYPAQHPEKAQLPLPWEQYHKCIWAFIWVPLAPVCAWQVLVWCRARQALKTSTCNPS